MAVTVALRPPGPRDPVPAEVALGRARKRIWLHADVPSHITNHRDLLKYGRSGRPAAVVRHEAISRPGTSGWILAGCRNRAVNPVGKRTHLNAPMTTIELNIWCVWLNICDLPLERKYYGPARAYGYATFCEMYLSCWRTRICVLSSHTLTLHVSNLLHWSQCGSYMLDLTRPE